MRAFIAIELPKEIKDALGELQGELKKSGADVKWVEPQNIHLTLKFLGEIDAVTLSKISDILEDTAKDKNAFHIRISCLGAFPKINYPKVLWLSIDKGDNEVKEIAKQLKEKIAKAGVPREDRPFSTHITIGRTRSTLNRERLVQDLKNLALHKSLAGQSATIIGGLEFVVTKLIIFKSSLTPKGPIYEGLKEANLKTA